MNEQEIAGAVGSAALQQRRRGASGLWLSLERRGRMHLLLCADLVRFCREEVAEAAAAATAETEAGAGAGARGGENHSAGGVSSAAAAYTQADDGRREASGKRKPALSATQDSGSSSFGSGAGGHGARKRPRATDPWEDILAALNPKASAGGGRSSSIPGSGSGR